MANGLTVREDTLKLPKAEVGQSNAPVLMGTLQVFKESGNSTLAQSAQRTHKRLLLFDREFGLCTTLEQTFTYIGIERSALSVFLELRALLIGNADR